MGAHEALGVPVCPVPPILLAQQHIDIITKATSARPCPLRPVGRHLFLPATLQSLCPSPIYLSIPETL